MVLSYLAGLDALVKRGKPLSTAFQLTAMYASALLHDLDGVEAEGYKGNPEVPIDDFLRPVSVRHSLARRDRDRIKRVSLGMRRLLRGGAGSSRRRRGRSQGRLLSRDYFDESLYLLALHVRATGEGAESLDYWRQRALSERGVDLDVDLDVALGRIIAQPEAANLEPEDPDSGSVVEWQDLGPEAESVAVEDPGEELGEDPGEELGEVPAEVPGDAVSEDFVEPDVGSVESAVDPELPLADEAAEAPADADPDLPSRRRPRPRGGRRHRRSVPSERGD